MSTAPSSPSNTPASIGTEPPAPPQRARPSASRRSVIPAPLPRTAVAGLLLAALVAWMVPVRAAIVEEIVAKVNNRIISKSEFEERSTYILKQIYQQYSGDELDRQLRDAQESMLSNMITELLLLDRAESLLDLSKVRKNLVDDFRKQQNIASDDDLEKVLKDQGMKRKDLEEQLIRLAVPQEIINYEVRRKISVSEAEIKDYYDAHQKGWETAPTVSFNEIAMFYEDANRPEVLSRAQGVVREARGGGTDFGELVQKYSEAPSKEAGGFLGPLGAAQPRTGRGIPDTHRRPGWREDPAGRPRPVGMSTRAEQKKRLGDRAEPVLASLSGLRPQISPSRHAISFLVRGLHRELGAPVRVPGRKPAVPSPERGAGVTARNVRDPRTCADSILETRTSRRMNREGRRSR